MKNMRKKILVVIILVLSLFVLSSCQLVPQIINNANSEDIKITFISDGEVFETNQLKQNETMKEPKLPENKSQKFLYWTEDGNVSWNFKYPFEKDTTLYAKYEIDYPSIINNISLETIKSNVKIYNKTYNVNSYLGIETSVNSMQGSGVIFHEDYNYYYAITNTHVTEIGNKKYQSLEVQDYKGNRYTAKKINSQSEQASYDLSVVAFEKKYKTELKVLKFADKNPAIKDKVIAIGQPEGQNNSITLGEIKKYQRVTTEKKKALNFDVIAHTAPIDHGSSGGVLLNHNFEIIGINYAGQTDQNDMFVEAYAVPVEKVKEFLNLYIYKK